jgi:hypothetical protein
MTPHEIFARISPEGVAAIFTHFYENEKPLYKATLETLAKQRKLRPVFVERKPRGERFQWMREAVSRKSNDGVAAQLLQIWLVGSQTPLLCGFLDGLGIKHDENGTIEEMPPSPEREALEKVIAGLLEKHERETVAIYLHAFQALDDNGWPALGEILESDPRLALGQS